MLEFFHEIPVQTAEEEAQQCQFSPGLPHPYTKTLIPAYKQIALYPGILEEANTYVHMYTQMHARTHTHT